MGGAQVKRFGLFGSQSKDFLTYGGRILWHDNQPEMEFMVPLGTATIREIPRDIPDEQMMPLLDHPQFEGVRRPVTREQFRRAA
jgi:hypothetical protein